jgi:hypothetical protein
VESVVRSFKSTPSFVARWDYPHWVLSEDLDASRAAKPGAKKKQGDDKLLALIPSGEDNAAFFGDMNLGISKQQFIRRIKDIDAIQVIKLVNSTAKHENAYYR